MQPFVRYDCRVARRLLPLPVAPGRPWPFVRRACTCVLVTLLACGEGAIDTAPTSAVTPPAAAPSARYEDEILALERRDAALGVPEVAQARHTYPAELRSLHRAWRELEAKTRGTAYEGYCALRVEQYQQRREEVARRFHELAFRPQIEIWARDGQWDKCRAAYDEFAAQHEGTRVAASLVVGRAHFESKVRDVVSRFDWRIEFAERADAGDLAGARFRRHDPALVIHAATDVVYEQQRLRFVRSGTSVLELSCVLDTVPADAEWRMTLAATTTFGVSYSRCSLAINDRRVFVGWTVADDYPNTYFWPVGAYLVPGENRIRVSLDVEARTVLGVIDVGLIGRR